MSTEILNFVKNIDKREMETQLALQCSPLIMRIKIANLFTITERCQNQVEKVFQDTDLKVMYLLKSCGKITYLMYQEKQLGQYLCDGAVYSFLWEYGYHFSSLEEMLKLFQQRYSAYMFEGDKFPHEMGIFLGYPLEDVRGFIRNKGKNYLYAGYWKVYHNPDTKLELFREYDRARNFVMELITQGMSITSIINFCNDNDDFKNIFFAGTDSTAV